MTYLQAKEHLMALIEFASAKNEYLSCVRELLRTCKVDIIGDVRAQEIKSIDRLIELLDLQNLAEKRINAFLAGSALT